MIWSHRKGVAALGFVEFRNYQETVATSVTSVLRRTFPGL